MKLLKANGKEICIKISSQSLGISGLYPCCGICNRLFNIQLAKQPLWQQVKRRLDTQGLDWFLTLV
jgi:hypothetical protein